MPCFIEDTLKIFVVISLSWYVSPLQLLIDQLKNYQIHFQISAITKKIDHYNNAHIIY
jgi:hypothetical protein